MQLVLLLRLGDAVKGPGGLGDGSSSDGRRDPDGGSGSAVKQVVGAHVKGHGGLDWVQTKQSALVTLFLLLVGNHITKGCMSDHDHTFAVSLT